MMTDKTNSPVPSNVPADSTTKESSRTLVVVKKKKGVRGRSDYRFLKRKPAAPKTMSKFLLKRTSQEAVCREMTVDGPNGSLSVRPCCSNHCISKLIGSPPDLFTACPTSEESVQRQKFVEAVIATRKAVHSEGQISSANSLVNRLRIGISAGLSPLTFAEGYSFPQQRSVTTQEYWWRTEELGACVQVECFLKAAAQVRR